jgi:hypothetical protein
MSTSATGLEIYNYPRRLQLALLNLQNNAKISATNRQLILRFHEKSVADGLSTPRLVKYIHILSKLAAIAPLAVVVVAGAVYWLFYPKPTSEIMNQTSEGTSLEVSRKTSEQTWPVPWFRGMGDLDEKTWVVYTLENSGLLHSAAPWFGL